jgi:general secretion pathway protein G
MKPTKGFTLIELLVVIAIIGLLSSIVLAALNSARTKAYDAARLSNLINVKTALEVYYAANGSYPNTSGNYLTACSNSIGNQVAANSVIPNLVPAYIAALPVDPQMNSSGNQCCYLYEGSATDYKFMFYSCVNNSVACTGAQNAEPSLPNPGRANSCAVYSSGASAW